MGASDALLGTTFDCEKFGPLAQRQRVRPRNFNERCNVLENSNELPQFVSPNQAADRLAVCRRTIERLVAAQKLRVVKIGRATRIPVSELLRYVESVTQRSASNGGAS